MRKLLMAIAAFCMFAGIATPANAFWDWSETAPATASVAQAETTYKMGGLPNHYTICVANGIAGYNTEFVLEKWTQLSYGALNLSVRNVCTGFSITNRMTVTTYSSPNGGCGIFTNTGSHWDAVQGKNIWDENPVIWLNTRDTCVPNDTAYAHRLAMYVGYILGIDYAPYGCSYVMTSTTCGINGIKYVTTQDRSWAAGIYGLAA